MIMILEKVLTKIYFSSPNHYLLRLALHLIGKNLNSFILILLQIGYYHKKGLKIPDKNELFVFREKHIT